MCEMLGLTPTSSLLLYLGAAAPAAPPSLLLQSHAPGEEWEEITGFRQLLCLVDAVI